MHASTRRRQVDWPFLLILSVCWVNALPARAAENPLFTELIEQGVNVGPHEGLRLPAPTMPDNLSGKEQAAALESIADSLRTVDALTRRSVVAPFVLTIDTVRDDAGMGRTRRVDVSFVAHGDLDALAEEGFLRRLGSAAEESRRSELPTTFKILDQDDLAERQLEAVEREGFRDFYYHSTFHVLERVLLGATRRANATRGDDSLLLAARLDARFVRDPDYPTQWAPITRDELGRPVIGEAQAYTDAAFYIKATRLKDYPGAVFFEYHLVYEEPHGWFSGANLLRSKLPLVVQNAVRDFRREFARSLPADDHS